jgi:hypothetical protein
LVEEWINLDLDRDRTVSQLRRLVAGVLQRRPGYSLRRGRVGFVVDKVNPCEFSSSILL